MASRISSNGTKTTTKITDLPPDIMITQILTRIDPQSLVSTALASPKLRTYCSNEKLWTDICNSAWNSMKHPEVRNTISAFPGGYHAFFSDSFSILHFQNMTKKWWHYNRHSNTPVLMAEQLISAVDIQYKNNIVCSKVDVIDSNTERFQSSTFKVEVLDKKECLRFEIDCEDEDMCRLDLLENMRLSWIIIDPTQKRAANLSSQILVTVRYHSVGGNIEVKYAIVMPWRCTSELVEIRIIVMVQWEAEGKFLKLKEVKLQVCDMDKMCLSGKQSLEILQEAIRSGIRKKGKKGDETKIYTKFLERKRLRREENLIKGKGSKTIPLIAIIFLAFITSLALKISISV